MKLLHLDSSIQGGSSASRAVSASIVDRLRATHSDLEIVYRDLAAAPLPHLTLDAFAGAQAQELMEEFLDAGIVVIGAGMYNFTIPSQLKAWLDRILVSGRTFRYGANGPEGLVSGKRVIIALTRGGLYGKGAPAAALEHAETYLRGVFAFIGVTNPEFIIAEGLALGDEARRSAIDTALDRTARIDLDRAAA